MYHWWNLVKRREVSIYPACGILKPPLQVLELQTRQRVSQEPYITVSKPQASNVLIFLQFINARTQRNCIEWKPKTKQSYWSYRSLINWKNTQNQSRPEFKSRDKSGITRRLLIKSKGKTGVAKRLLRTARRSLLLITCGVRTAVWEPLLWTGSWMWVLF